MDEELALLRNIAANPFDAAIRGAYRDWLIERGRQEESDTVARTITLYKGSDSANFMTNADLIGILLKLPMDAIPLHTVASDYDALHPEDVTLIRAEEKKIIWRQENGFSDYRPEWFETDEQAKARAEADAARMSQYGSANPAYLTMLRNRRDNRLVAEKPDFRTVIYIS